MILTRMITCLLVVVAVGTTLAEEASLCDAPCQARVNAAFSAAEQLENDAQYAAAAQLYAAVISEAPMSIKSQVAAIRSGMCLVRIDKVNEAMHSYQIAISIANELQNSMSQTEAESLKRWKHEAMF